MAIVATPEGGPVPCPGGPKRLRMGGKPFGPSSHAQVDAIQARFDALSPYDPGAVPHLLKLEFEGLCYAVSAKRYAPYTLDARGEPVFDEDHPPSEHGLGHFLSPDEAWIKEFWRIVVRKAHGKETVPPPWFSRPTMVRTTVTSTAVRHAFRRLNEGRTYAKQIKPFNFLLTAAGAKPPAGHRGDHFRLVAPYESDPTKWEQAEFIDVHNPDAATYLITTRDGRPGLARAGTFTDVLAEYETHPEAKSLGPDGRPCDRSTIGLLQRRPVTVGKITLIGKESNQLEEREAGELTREDVDQWLTTYEDHDEWYRLMLPMLRQIGVREVARAVNLSERRIRDLLLARARPHPAHLQALRRLADD